MYDKLPIIPNKNRAKTIIGRDFYVRLFEKIEYKNYALVFFNSKKINVYTFKKRLFKKLVYYGLRKGLAKLFCSAIIREIKIDLKQYLPTSKTKKKGSKFDTHLFKGKSKFRISSNGYNSLQNESSELEYLFFEDMVRELKSCKIIDKNSIKNLYKLRELRLDGNFRVHEYRWVFSSLDIDLLRVIRYISKNGAIRNNNLTIWSNSNNTKPKATSLIVSISSKQNKELYNSELLFKGFEQLKESLPIVEALILLMKLWISRVSVELGVKILEGFENFKPYPYTYRIYKMKYWVDSSCKGRELDFRYETNLDIILKTLKLIEEIKLYYKLLEKGILTIEPFSLENNNITNDFTKKAKGSYIVIVFLKRVKSFLMGKLRKFITEPDSVNKIN